MSKIDELNLSGQQALWALNKAIDERKLSRADVRRYIADVDREVEALRTRIEELKELSGAVRSRGRGAARSKVPAEKAAAKVSRKTAASQKLQGVYLSLIQRIPKTQRTKYKMIVAEKGRKAAIEAMRAALEKKSSPRNA